MRRALFALSCFGFFAGFVGVGAAQAVPPALQGRWRIARVLPTANPQCFNAVQARALIGNLLTYKAHRMIWDNNDVAVPETLTRTLSREQFRLEYKVDFSALGLRGSSVTELDLQHEDADFTHATTEVPGDTVLLAGLGRVVVSACGVYYMALRVR